jgi:uncharacterized protein DUF4398
MALASLVAFVSRASLVGKDDPPIGPTWGEQKRETMEIILNRMAIALAIASGIGASGCVSHSAPAAKAATSEAAIRAAEETGSRDVPQAALHLKLAQEQLERAKALIRDNENQRAEYVLARAEADAELAIALARAEKSKALAGKALDEVRAVRTGAPKP